MLNFMVNAEGGLTTAGYAICIVLGIVVFGIALFFAGKNSEKNKMSAKQLACCAMAMALAFITSYIKIFSLPWGGSVTLCSMLFIVLVVWSKNRNSGWIYIWNAPVFTGAIRTFSVPGML